MVTGQQPCDFRTGRARCGATPTVDIEGRGPLCASHAEFVAEERAARAARAARRSDLLERLDELNRQGRDRESMR